MRRLTGILALGALLLLPLTAQTQQTHQYHLDFRTDNQSMWSPSLSTAGF
jgi:hypothetical protein